jgi:hypothetical protein
MRYEGPLPAALAVDVVDGAPTEPVATGECLRGTAWAPLHTGDHMNTRTIALIALVLVIIVLALLLF